MLLDILKHPKTFRYKSKVDPSWIDYNNHMQDAYYNLVFSYGIDVFQEEIGLGDSYRRQTKNTLYALEFHNFFLLEVKQGAPLEVASVVIDNDHKRIHLAQLMFSNSKLVATNECIQLHVSQIGTPSAIEFPTEIYNAILERRMEQTVLSQLKYRSRQMGINNKKH